MLRPRPLLPGPHLYLSLELQLRLPPHHRRPPDHLGLVWSSNRLDCEMKHKLIAYRRQPRTDVSPVHERLRNFDQISQLFFKLGVQDFIVHQTDQEYDSDITPREARKRTGAQQSLFCTSINQCPCDFYLYPSVRPSTHHSAQICFAHTLDRVWPHQTTRQILARR